MRYLEIQPRGGSHYLVLDGQVVSRHNDLRVAEAVRNELLRDSIISSDSAPGADAEPENENACPRGKVKQALQSDEEKD